MTNTITNPTIPTASLESLQNDYHQLQMAFHQLEEEKLVLEERLRKIKRRRSFLVAVIVITGLGVGGYFWAEELNNILPKNDWIATEPQIPVDADIFVVEPELFQTKLSLTGKIEPLDQMEVISPLEGPIQAKRFEYGELVKKGQTLLVIDTTQEKVNYREASATYIRYQQTVKKLRHWKTDPEVTMAQRNLLKAKYTLESTERELAETQRLFEKGIVPALELDNLKRRSHNEQLDYQSMQEQLQQTLEKGNQQNLRVAELEMKNARFRQQQIQQRIKNARVVSPIDGVVLLPINQKEETRQEIQRGSFVKQDQVLFMIANMAGFTIKAKVDEVEIPKLQINQTVTITGDAFEDITLEGAISRISSQADKQTMSSDESASLFPVTIAVSKLTAAQKQHLRLGMSTKMEVILSEKPEALMVPFKLLISEEKQTWVTKLPLKPVQLLWIVWRY